MFYLVQEITEEIAATKKGPEDLWVKNRAWEQKQRVRAPETNKRCLASL
jgi:hypothetical protein